MKLFGSLLITILFLPTINSNVLFAEDRPTIELATATLALGMQKEDVLTYLNNKQMQLTPTDEKDEKSRGDSF